MRYPKDIQKMFGSAEVITKQIDKANKVLEGKYKKRRGVLDILAVRLRGHYELLGYRVGAVVRHKKSGHVGKIAVMWFDNETMTEKLITNPPPPKKGTGPAFTPSYSVDDYTIIRRGAK